MDNSGPTFPHLRHECQRINDTEMYGGLTKRELAAMFAMAGMLANTTHSGDFDAFATDSVKQADALLAALKEAKP
jgi:hypothetical protein